MKTLPRVCAAEIEVEHICPIFYFYQNVLKVVWIEVKRFMNIRMLLVCCPTEFENSQETKQIS